jgi:hypothetical protein
MLVSLCAYLFDYEANLLVDASVADSKFAVIGRRVTRTATLDGGCMIVDNGYSASDATFVVSIPSITKENANIIKYMVIRHSLLVLSCRAGCFLGVADAIDEDGGFKINFLVKEDMAA